MTDASPDPPVSEEAAWGKVWVMILGTRGDTQPYIALALALMKVGYRVRVFAPRDLAMVNGEKQGKVAELVKSCGIDCVECQDDEYCDRLAGTEPFWESEARKAGAKEDSEVQTFKLKEVVFPRIDTVAWLNLKTYETCDNLMEAVKICESRTKKLQDSADTGLSISREECLQRVREAHEESIAFQAAAVGMTIKEYWPIWQQRKEAFLAKMPGDSAGVIKLLMMRQALYTTYLDRLARSLIGKGISEVDVLRAMATEQRDWLTWQTGRDLDDYFRAWGKLNPFSLGPAQVQGYSPGERPSEIEARLLFEELRAAHHEGQPFWPLVHEAYAEFLHPFRPMLRAVVPRMAELAVRLVEEEPEAKPDLVIYNELAMNAALMMWSKYGVDTLYSSLQWSLPGKPADIAGRFLLHMDMDFYIHAIAGVSPCRDMGMEGHYRLIVNPRQLAAYTCLLVPDLEGLEAADPGAKSRRDRLRSNCTGAWVMAAEDQLGVSDVKSFGGEEAKKEVLEFLEAGDAPVYMGWGSMQYPHGAGKLTALVARSLKMAGLRGIFCAGWSGGGLEALKEEVGDEDPDELVAYCKRSVLFLKAAPHAWLFPRCSATVHHGGAGTTHAALHSGVPTVVAPVFADQFMYGPWVQNLGCGKCVSALAALQAPELSRALLDVLGDETMRQTSTGVAQLMREEPGVGGAVAMVHRIFLTEIRSGAAADLWRARRDVEYFGLASSGAPHASGHKEADLEEIRAELQGMGFSQEQVAFALEAGCGTAAEAIELILGS